MEGGLIAVQVAHGGLWMPVQSRRAQRDAQVPGRRRGPVVRGALLSVFTGPGSSSRECPRSERA